MFKIGEIVMYSKVGPCRIVKVGGLDIKGIDKKRQYYTLEPVYDNGTVFAPIDTKIPMRKLLTEDEVNDIIDSMPEIETGDLSMHRAYDIKNAFNDRLASQNAEDLITVLKTIYLKGRAAKEAGKNISATDQGYVKQAEKLLYGEFALSLGIEYDQVDEYIANRVGKKII